MALFVLPRGSAYGQNVTSFSGAKMYFFEAGSTTAKTTYSDPGLSTPNADPVVADSNGVFDAIFLSGTYKVVLKDSADVTIWTEDNLTARDGDVTYQGTFDSTTNSGDYPSTGNTGDKYLVTEEFQLNAASGSHFLRVNDWIFCNKDGATGIDADWEIELGINSRPKPADWSAKNLIINVDGNTSATVTADAIELVNSAGEGKRITSVSDTYDITTDIDTGTEYASMWYQLWIDEDEQLLMCVDFASTADENVANQLIDNAAGDFETDGIAAGDIIYNTSLNTKGYVGTVVSGTTISCVDASGTALDLFPEGSGTYVIHKESPTGIGAYKANIGAVYNDAGSDLDSLHQVDTEVNIAEVTVVNNGTTATYEAVNVGSAIPITAKRISGRLKVDDDNNDSNCALYVAGDSNGLGAERINVVGAAAGAIFHVPFSLLLQSPHVLYYKVLAGDIGTVAISGFKL